MEMMWDSKIKFAGELLPRLDAFLPADLQADIERSLGLLLSHYG